MSHRNPIRNQRIVHKVAFNRRFTSKADESQPIVASFGSKIQRKSFWEQLSPVKRIKSAAKVNNALIEQLQQHETKKYRPDMFGEMKLFNDTDGKILHGSSTLIPVAEATIFPEFQCCNLHHEKSDLQQILKNGKISILLTNFKNSGLQMTPEWLFTGDGHSSPKPTSSSEVQLIHLSIIEEWYFKIFKSAIVKGLKTHIPEGLHTKSFYAFGWKDNFRTVMEMYNSFVCYVHLIDDKGRIRWMSAGHATEKEKVDLKNLIGRLKEQKIRKSKPT
uniref:Uncharacterized protein AlNc14C9G1163 n=1 Tax=Albugo laibachii Nc14 TaxID=890382 RepID=F0W2B3_9STRA|nr:conserved hypothetical protein [Albugo laibachii Nc14]|eukprot:CCA15198.1 conserved hypothetical protein [Albugo laibachii Nc14]